jgi:GT2 family glycosyltransferase
MKVTVIVPTWKRAGKLAACLRSLEAQTEQPDLVLVVARREDQETRQLLKGVRAPWLRVLEVQAPGVVHAENRALAHIRDGVETDVVTFMDDDAIATPDWIGKIKHHFRTRPDSIALGGPDIIIREPGTYHDVFVRDVGVVTWYGKVIGQHHRRSEGLRPVDVLKGVNFSLRRSELLLLDERLQGVDPARGNGVFWELDLCLRLARRGGKLFFDPALVIHHDSDHSHFVPAAVIESTAHNLTYVLLKNLPLVRKVVFLLYAVLVGNGHVRGIARTLRDIVRERRLTPLASAAVSLRGLVRGALTYVAGA